MRFVVLLLLLASVPGWATPLLFHDPFPGPQWPASGYDVIGNRSDFDIQWMSAEITQDAATFQLAFNSRYSDLRPFTESGLHLGIGDLLFYVNDVAAYGVPVVSHAGSPNQGPSGLTVAAGHLYEINDPATGVLTAKQVLNNPQGATYRTDEDVWLRNNGQGSLTDLAAGTVAIAALGNGFTNAEYLVTIQFVPTADFLRDLQGPGLGLHFASATCANDVIAGDVVGSFVETPEASTNLLVGGGLILLGVLSRRLRRQR